MDQSIDSELCVAGREPWTTRLDAIRVGEAEYAGKVPAACGGLIESIDSCYQRRSVGEGRRSGARLNVNDAREDHQEAGSNLHGKAPLYPSR